MISSKVVLKIQHNNRILYFCECEEHLPIKQYVKEFIEFYFCYIFEDYEYAESDIKRINQSLEKEDNFSAFINMSGKYNCRDLYPGGRLETADPQIVGLDAYEDENYILRLKRFLKYALCKLNSYYQNEDNNLHIKYSSRALAYKRIAQLLGFGDSVPDCQYAYICIDHEKTIFGLVSENVGGVLASQLSHNERLKRANPILQRCLTSMNVIDYLCVVRDHTKYNYNVLINNGTVYGLGVFDNDEDGAFPIERTVVVNGAHGESSLINEDGSINRPYLDINIAKRLSKIKIWSLYSNLWSILNYFQIIRVWQRLLVLKKAIRKAESSGKCRVLYDHQWNQETMKEEISGKYGKTYLVDFLAK